jgi:hypothetical protein
MIDIIRRTGISLLAGFLVRTDAGRLPFTSRLRLFKKPPAHTLCKYLKLLIPREVFQLFGKQMFFER